MSLSVFMENYSSSYIVVNRLASHQCSKSWIWKYTVSGYVCSNYLRSSWHLGTRPESSRVVWYTSICFSSLISGWPLLYVYIHWGHCSFLITWPVLSSSELVLSAAGIPPHRDIVCTEDHCWAAVLRGTLSSLPCSLSMAEYQTFHGIRRTCLGWWVGECQPHFPLLSTLFRCYNSNIVPISCLVLVLAECTTWQGPVGEFCCTSVWRPARWNSSCVCHRKICLRMAENLDGRNMGRQAAGCRLSWIPVHNSCCSQTTWHSNLLNKEKYHLSQPVHLVSRTQTYEVAQIDSEVATVYLQSHQLPLDNHLLHQRCSPACPVGLAGIVLPGKSRSNVRHLIS